MHNVPYYTFRKANGSVCCISQKQNINEKNWKKIISANSMTSVFSVDLLSNFEEKYPKFILLKAQAI